VLAFVADRIPVELIDTESEVVQYARGVGAVLQWPADRIRLSGPAQ